MTASTCSATGSKLLGEKPLKNSTYTKIFYFGNLCAHEFQLQKGPGFWVPSAPSAKRDLDLGSHKRNLDFWPQKGTWIFGRWKSKMGLLLVNPGSPKGTWMWGRPQKEPGFGVPQKEPGFWTPKRNLDFWPREIQNWTVSGSPQRNLDVGSTPKEPGCFRGQFPQKSQFPRKFDPKHAPDPQKHPTFREISPLLQLWT